MGPPWNYSLNTTREIEDIHLIPYTSCIFFAKTTHHYRGWSMYLVLTRINVKYSWLFSIRCKIWTAAFKSVSLSNSRAAISMNHKWKPMIVQLRETETDRENWQIAFIADKLTRWLIWNRIQTIIYALAQHAICIKFRFFIMFSYKILYFYIFYIIIYINNFIFKSI